MEKRKRILYLMSRAANRLKYYSMEKFSNAGISASPAQMGILFILKNGEPETMSSLSSALSVDNSTLTRHAEKLIKNGYVERIQHPSDRRALMLRITKNGIREGEKAEKIARQINTEVLSALTEEEIAALIKALMVITEKF